MNQLPDIHTCSYCQQFVIDLDRKRPPLRPDAPEAALPNIFGNSSDIFFFDATLGHLIEGVSRHCDLCVWLDTEWTSKYGARYTKLAETGQDVFVCAESYSMSLADPYPVDELLFVGLWDMNAPLDPKCGRCYIRCQLAMDVFTTREDIASKFIWNRPVNLDPGSRENFELARKWLNDCITSHHDCVKSKATYMPARVLEVRCLDGLEDFGVRIVSANTPEPYVALSYCWGGDQPHKTTTARMRSNDWQIRYDKLPKSIQDAVKTTVNLDIRYLWVDSLCIIQDDDKDKMAQIAEMPAIYNHASVTIIASKASRATEGFLHKMEWNKKATLAVKVPFQCPGPEGKIGSAYIAHLTGSRDTEPIHYRAWTLQERYLSNRLLEFDTLQTRWVCGSTQEKAGYCDGWKRGDTPEDSPMVSSVIFGEIERTTSSLISRSANKQQVRESLVGSWTGIVRNYTLRDLTVSTDRILAISGIAAMFGSYLPNQYLAGLWNFSLPSHLCWQIEGAPRPRPSEYQGPSWSWVTVNGPVNFLLGEASIRDCRASLIGSRVELVEPKAVFGAVKSGTLTLRGRMRKASWLVTTSGDGITSRLEYHADDVVGSDSQPLELIRVMPDAAEHSDQGNGSSGPMDVFLFEIGNCVGLNRRGPVGLVLRAAPMSEGEKGSSPCFTRIAVFHISRKFTLQRPKGLSNEKWNQLAEAPLHDERLERQARWFENTKPIVIEIK